MAGPTQTALRNQNHLDRITFLCCGGVQIGFNPILNAPEPCKVSKRSSNLVTAVPKSHCEIPLQSESHAGRPSLQRRRPTEYDRCREGLPLCFCGGRQRCGKAAQPLNGGQAWHARLSKASGRPRHRRKGELPCRRHSLGRCRRRSSSSRGGMLYRRRR